MLTSCENPSGNATGGDVEIAGALTGSMGGRPPDVNSEEGGLDLEGKDSTMVDGEAAGENLHRLVNPSVSFKQSLLGTSDKQRVSESIEELDVNITDADVRISGASGLPEIWFSDRVHDEIDSKLAKSMIIRLLGKTIGYRALWNRIMALWTPVGEINLIDLDNEYYLVQFANEEDFQKVLSGGPWVIYGSYLTVQPWSRYFNSAEDHPSHIMVWARLPKLLYRYYTKSLFKYIAATIGNMVKVDYNTTKGKMRRFARLALIVDLSKPLVSDIIIDGRRQDIEYEGLPTICFKCGKYGHAKEVCGVTEPAPGSDTITDKRKPEDLYGPWMQVVNRRRRNVGNQNLGVNGGARKEKDTRGSRFTLDVIDHASALPERTGESAEQQRKWQIAQRKSVGAANAAGKSRAGLAIPTGNPGIGAVQAKDDVSVASPETVVRASSSLNGDKHVAVRIGSEEDSRTTMIGRGRILHASIRGLASESGSKVQLGVKGISKVTLKSSKSDDRGALKNGPGDHLNNMVSDLNKAAFDEELWRDQSRDIDDTEEGALDPGFNRSFKLLVRRQKPDIVVIMEPRISGREADRFIHRSGFEFSYRVEANGFSGGIWVLWRGTINVQVLAVSNQCIHAFCSAGSASSWVLGGDLNVIGTVLERSGGSSRRLGVCSLFSDFMFDSGLIDLGYNGPQYTWRRGNLFQRLDRCLCNSTWVRLFPHSEVYHLLKLGSDHRPIMLSTMKIGTKPVSRPFRYLSAWNDHPYFSSFLSSLWGDGKSFRENVSCFQGFGDVVWPSLVRLEERLKGELDVVLGQEESIWHQKSQALWINQGDRNTSYFHMMAYVRQKRNTVRMLRIEDGLQPRSGSSEANFRQVSMEESQPLLAAITMEESLWIRVLKSKYRWKEILPLSIKRNECSRLWTGLCTIWEDLKECIHWEVHDGKDTDFWYDHWLGKEPRLVTTYFGAAVPRPVRVGDMVLANGEWDWDALATMLPKDTMDLIASVLPPQEGVGVDMPGWRWEDKRCFSTCSAYEYLAHGSPSGDSVNWKRIWKLEVPQRIQVFIWLVFHERLMTNVERARRHMTSLVTCEIFGSGHEDIAHVLLSCTAAKGLRDNLFGESLVAGDAVWGIRFEILCSLLWKRRCNFLFGTNVELSDHIVSRGNRMVGECSQPAAANLGPRQGQGRRPSWTRPHTGWIKANVDVSVSMVDRSAGADGVLRDDNGAWVSGYARYVGRCDALLAELWAIHDGLLLAWDLGFQLVELESDCLEAVRVISSRSNVLSTSALVGSIASLISREWTVEVRHITRDSNGVADKLAKRGRVLGMDSTIFVAAPAVVAGLVEAEQRDAFAPSYAPGPAVDPGGYTR
ncbi:hypothetical protein GQ457_12G008990 [Hibiscus cannabinus]